MLFGAFVERMGEERLSRGVVFAETVGVRGYPNGQE